MKSRNVVKLPHEIQIKGICESSVLTALPITEGKLSDFQMKG